MIIKCKQVEKGLIVWPGSNIPCCQVVRVTYPTSSQINVTAQDETGKQHYFSLSPNETIYAARTWNG